MKLYLVQHGEAQPKDLDPDRPLTEAGRAATEKTAGFSVRQARVSVDTIFHSGKSRAEQTAEILGKYLLPAGGVHSAKDLSPNDDPNLWAMRLTEIHKDVMMVGHLPHLSRLAAILLGREADSGVVAFTNSGIVCLEKDHSSHWRLNWAVIPDILLA